LDQARSSRRLEMHFDRLEKSLEWGFGTEESEAVPTTFRPLSKVTTATLLAHGYLSAMTNCHLLLDFPMVDEVPPLEDFQRLAEDMARQRRPAPLREAADSL
jgi:hypothetical protein